LKDDLLNAAAIVTVEVLRQTQETYGEITEGIIASAFEQAYRGIEEGMLRISAQRVNNRLEQDKS
jgi:hypothetical protein